MYEPPSREWSLTWFRNAFLYSIQLNAKEVLEDLGQDPYEFYIAARMYEPRPFPGSNLERLSVYHWLSEEIVKKDSRIWAYRIHRAPQKMFCDVLIEWAKRHNIYASWVIDCAMHTLYRWYLKNRQPGFTGERGWMLLGNGGSIPSIPPPPPGLAKFSCFTDKAGYLDSCVNAVRRQFDGLFKDQPEFSYGNQSLLNAYIESIKDEDSDIARYCDEAENHIRECGWVKSERHINLERDMRWTVQFQVQKMDFEKIAASEPSPRNPQKNIDVSTVSRAVIGYQRKGKSRVLGTLDKIGLTRRPESGPGRRRGRRESADSWRRSTSRAQIPK